MAMYDNPRQNDDDDDDDHNNVWMNDDENLPLMTDSILILWLRSSATACKPTFSLKTSVKMPWKFLQKWSNTIQ